MNSYITATEREIVEADIHSGVKKLQKINTPFGYFGSKNKIALQLCSQLPPHNCWVEVFCGSAALTLSKAKAPIEVINDIDKNIINLFQQLRDNYDELIRLIQFTPYAEQELFLARLEEPNLTNVEQARRFLVQSMMAINGIFGDERGGFSYSDSYSRNGHEARVNRWNNLPNRLYSVVKRLKSVRIENKDAKVIIKRFLNRPATLLYLDPPYLGERTNGYNIDANDEDFHLEILNLANKASCMILISGYDNELYDSILTRETGWTTKKIVTATKGSNGTSYKRTEVLWMNKYFTEALNENQVPLILTQEEKKQKKVNPERKIISAKKINNILNLNSEHSLYREDGKWYHHLNNFPGILFDYNGYVVFKDENEYLSHPFLQHGEDLHVTGGISTLKEYITFSDEDKIKLSPIFK